ncbi:unnamed protein product [Vitrella brassicaformis CCMP3155]|uniref:Uncharacterized protein n=2 Tax=Vitrella brassicaformis TaxID=1169539 RepID=A0A0G4ETR0_VITBC|nr:unnamed protein product [Vitrella brassicaformis CCMP3155]|mmetsp:Transcript_32213/g.79811  ORF Transcript_32213/g.79811 Transcript_32213/m.79811 type:complete len:157 (+) Transcript_32213:66-536(+)|eukprot:CEM01639.1 unnamed protein product [Vitrella brassicaformis CCMP3155]
MTSVIFTLSLVTTLVLAPLVAAAPGSRHDALKQQLGEILEKIEKKADKAGLEQPTVKAATALRDAFATIKALKGDHKAVGEEETRMKQHAKSTPEQGDGEPDEGVLDSVSEFITDILAGVDELLQLDELTPEQRETLVRIEGFFNALLLLIEDRTI